MSLSKRTNILFVILILSLSASYHTSAKQNRLTPRDINLKPDIYEEEPDKLDLKIPYPFPYPNLCSFKLYVYYYRWCQTVTFYPAISVPWLWNGSIQTYLWEFGDGNTSNTPYPTHVYANGGAYNVTLTVLAVDKKGNCCTRKFKLKVYVKECKPCDVLKSNYITTTNYGSLMKYEPSLPSNTYYAYKWNFSDGTSYSTREVYKTSFVLWAELTIWYIGNYKDCCKHTTKRYFKYFPMAKSLKLDSSKAVKAIDDSSNLMFNSKLSKDEIEKQVAKFMKENNAEGSVKEAEISEIK